MKAGDESPEATPEGKVLLHQAEQLASGALRSREGLPDLEYLEQLARLAARHNLCSITVGGGRVRLVRAGEDEVDEGQGDGGDEDEDY